MKRITLGIVFMLLLMACSTEKETVNKANEDEPSPYELYSQAVDRMNQEIYYYEENIIDMWYGELHYEQNISYIKDQEDIRYISHSYRTDWNQQYVEVIKEQPFISVSSDGIYYDLWIKWDGYCQVNESEKTVEESELFYNKMENYKQNDTIQKMWKEEKDNNTILIFNYIDLNGHTSNEMKVYIGETGYIDKITMLGLSKDGEPLLDIVRTWTYKNFNVVDNLDTEAAIDTLYAIEKTCPLDMNKNHICEGGEELVDAEESGLLLLDKIITKRNNDSLFIEQTAPTLDENHGQYYEYHLYRNVIEGDTEMRRTEGWFAIDKCTGETYEINVASLELIPYD